MSGMNTQLIGYPRAALAGLIGGVAMAMVAMMITGLLGMGALAVPKMIGGLVLGPEAVMNGGVGIVMLGLAVHMMLSVVFGLVYGFIVNSLTHEFWMTGLGFGIVLWIVNFYVVGLFLSGARMMAQTEPLWLAVMNHMVFGLVAAWVATVFARKALVAR